MDVAGVGPCFRRGCETRADRVLAHIGPLFGIAFTRTQDVIEKAGLPERSGTTERSEDALRRPLFPSLHEVGQGLCLGRGRAEEVHVIGHDHVAANQPAVTFFGGLPLGAEQGVNRIGCEERFAVSRASREEIDRAIDPDLREAAKVGWPDRGGRRCAPTGGRGV